MLKQSITPFIQTQRQKNYSTQTLIMFLDQYIVRL